MSSRVVQRPAAVQWLPAEPFAHLEDIHRRMNQFMHELAACQTLTAWTPAVDLEETNDECVIEIDLPGATASDIVVEHTDRSLSVRGHIPDREHNGVIRQHLRHTGPLHHTIGLPCTVLGDRITATMANGVLTIRAAKARPGPATRIHIVDPDDLRVGVQP
ncbi:MULTISPECIES: Hsp20/alpha crystallin family protein [unclassified Kribbella]|uniref:Hsp20/alpha crystallin family protein n=1 Tax=unclassified Kribbella TaxID=2644121 RepID=UPI0033EC6015